MLGFFQKRFHFAKEDLLLILSAQRDDESVPQFLQKFEFMEQWVEALNPGLYSEKSNGQMKPTTPRQLATQEAWVWDRLDDFEDIWKSIDFALSDIESPVNIGSLSHIDSLQPLLAFKQVFLLPSLSKRRSVRIGRDRTDPSRRSCRNALWPVGIDRIGLLRSSSSFSHSIHGF